MAVVDYEQLTPVERTCLGVAFGRWHASSQGTQSCTWPDGTPWYSDPLGTTFVAALPPERRQEMEEVRLRGDSWMRLFCAVRTAEIDHQIQEALKDAGIRQMVLLGAGMDTRAWRLQWPPGFSVFEVDSQQVLDFKHRLLGQQQDNTATKAGVQVSLPQTSCEQRSTVVADASKAADTWASLLSAGMSPTTPTLWVLEGFIGYLKREDGNALLHHLITHSPPGSKIIMTAPPTPAEQARSASAQPENGEASDSSGQGNGAATTTAAAGGAEGQGEGAHGGGDDGAVVKPYRPKLHHATFEEPTDTLARLVAAGWSNCKLLTSADLGAKYGVPTAQPILLGQKA